MKRKAFVKSLLGTSAFLSLPNYVWSENYNETLNYLEQIKTSTQGSMMSFSDKPIKTVNIGIIGLVIVDKRSFRCWNGCVSKNTVR